MFSLSSLLIITSSSLLRMSISSPIAYGSTVLISAFFFSIRTYFCKVGDVVDYASPEVGSYAQDRILTADSVLDRSIIDPDDPDSESVETIRGEIEISICTSTHSLSRFSGTGSNIIEPEFINHGKFLTFLDLLY
ncbi:unnamed protein product [Lactuca virosa]|uniref:Uncharacterized protein n=1 Tax=Lactuca virosa TaxID=75947 RepID=A0AAU9P393_9ASTR|nr:unnamed protein product [Lactuca virosa]